MIVVVGGGRWLCGRVRGVAAVGVDAWCRKQGECAADCGMRPFCWLCPEGNRVIIIQSLLAKLKPTETGSLERRRLACRLPLPESD